MLRFCLLPLCLLLPLAAQTTQSRILTPIDESQLTPLHGNVHPLAQLFLNQARFDRGSAPASMATGRLALILQRSPAQQQTLTQFLADVQNPGSPQFHRWLTPAQYGQRFGPSENDLTTVESWLQANGLQVEKVPAARNFIQFSGTVDQIQTAFHTSIHIFSIGGETHYSNVTDPEIPAALAPVVAGLTPLNDFHPRPNIRQGVTAHYDSATGSIQPDLTLFDPGNTPSLFVDPADAATIYDAPNAALNPAYASSTWDGTGVTIGILGTSDLTVSDVQNYRIAFLGETATTANLPTVIVDGGDPGLIGGAAGDEALLDNEVAGALAPKAKLDYYTSADTALASGLMNAWIRALDDNIVGILNISFSGCEAQQGTGGNQAILEAAQQAAAQGISVTVSAGDGGSAGCDDFDTAAAAQDGLAVNGLASTPWTIAVGGTDFDVLASSFSTYVNTATAGTPPYYRTALGYISEKPWNESTSGNTTIANNAALQNSAGATSIIAAGGGTSSCVTQSSSGVCLSGYAKPSFQASLTPSDNARDLPDVALFASNGFYGAYWVFCSDNATDGNTSQSYTECTTTGGQLTSSSSFGGVGGTSASAPAFAGILALVSESQGGARLGQADSILYQLAQSKPAVFHDVAAGNNSVVCAPGSPNCGSNGFLTGYNAGAGYDLASGLGSVDVAALIKNWNNVALAPTSTAFAIDGSSASYSGTHGTTLTFSTNVSATSGGGTPTGLVALADTAGQTSANSSQNGSQFTISLKNGSGSGTWNGLPGGSYTVTAQYAGDTANAASTSNPISVTIAPEPATAALTVSAANPLTGASITNLGGIPYGSQVVLSTQITGKAEGSKTQGLATGTVTFTDNSAALATASVDSENTASWPPLGSAVVALPAGFHSITAQYSGDASYEPTNSSAVAFTIVKAATGISAAASTGTVTETTSSSITLDLTTPHTLGALPSGSVVLSAGGSTLATIAVNASVQRTGASVVDSFCETAIVSGSQLAPGNNVITIAYSGDANYDASSTTVTLDNTAAASTNAPPAPGIALSSGGNLTLKPGATTGNTSTIAVMPSGGFTGPVNLSCAMTSMPSGASDLPTCALPASVSISGATAATATLTVNTTGPATTSAAIAFSPQKLFLAGGGATLALVFFFGIPARRRAWQSLFSLLAIACLFSAIAFSAVGCGGNTGVAAIQSNQQSNPGTTAGDYTVTVTGTDAATGKITASTIVSVTVN